MFHVAIKVLWESLILTWWIISLLAVSLVWRPSQLALLILAAVAFGLSFIGAVWSHWNAFRNSGSGMYNYYYHVGHYYLQSVMYGGLLILSALTLKEFSGTPDFVDQSDEEKINFVLHVFNWMVTFVLTLVDVAMLAQNHGFIFYYFIGGMNAQPPREQSEQMNMYMAGGMRKSIPIRTPRGPF